MFLDLGFLLSADSIISSTLFSHRVAITGDLLGPVEKKVKDLLSRRPCGWL